jgi:dihydropteroate synthase
VASAALSAGADIVTIFPPWRTTRKWGRSAPGPAPRWCSCTRRGRRTRCRTPPSTGTWSRKSGDYLAEAARRAEVWGISRDRIVLDPGIGFGKRPEDNLDLIAGLAEIVGAGYPVLVGLSRKAFIGAVTGRAVEGRLAGTLAANAAAVAGGASILRVHDVAETADAVRILTAINARKGKR